MKSELLFICSLLCCTAYCNISNQENTIMNKSSQFKTANVSYSNNKICKTLAVPAIYDDFKFGTGMTDPIWAKAISTDDFSPYKNYKLDRKSQMSLFRTADSLVIGFFFEEDKKDIQFQSDKNASIWSGDMAELHFGSMGPDGWLLQLGVGVNGGRFDSTGNFDKWKVKTFVRKNGWGAEIKIHNSAFCLTEGGIRFNICRQSLKKRLSCTWSPLQLRFHEVENFGELLFCDYKTAFAMRHGAVVENMTREEFEQRTAKLQIPAAKIMHGPYLSNPDKNSVSISWATAGKVPAFIQYREKNSNSDWIKVYSNQLNGILKHENAHFVHLTNLKPGAEYEYELFYLSPVIQKVLSTKIRRTFKMPAETLQNFSFFCATDIHSDVGTLRGNLKSAAARKANFLVLLGDLLSHAAGRESLYNGIIDPIVKEEQVNNSDRPVVFVRGNHEQLGVFASEYFNVMKHPSGRSYYSFVYGNTFFIALDCGNDSSDDGSGYFSNTQMQAEEQAFLKQIAASDAYKNAKFRIVMLHIPPLPINRGVYRSVYKMITPLIESANTPDLMLCGHMHEYMRIDANSTTYHPNSISAVYIKNFPETYNLPFPVIICDDKSGTEVTVSPSEININTFFANPDGSIAKNIDNIKVKAKK